MKTKKQIHHVAWNSTYNLYEVRTVNTVLVRYDHIDKAKAKVKQLNRGLMK